MNEKKLELKVGAFALAALAVVVALVVVLTGVFGSDRTELIADFAYAGGLPDGALVKFAGIKVGRVKRVEFRPEATDTNGRRVPVRVVLDVDAKAVRALRADASAAIGMQGALGESHIELLPGEAQAALPAGQAIRGLDAPRFDVLLSRMSDLMESAVSDEAFRSFLVEVSTFARKLNRFVDGHRDELKAVFPRVLSMLEDAEETLKDVRVASHEASRIIRDPKLKGMIDDLATTAHAAREELPPLVTNARTLLAKLDATAGAITPDDLEKVRGTLLKVDEIAKRLRQVSDDAGALLAGIEKGEGTAGKLVKDPTVYDDLRELLADLKAHPWKFVWKK